MCADGCLSIALTLSLRSGIAKNNRTHGLRYGFYLQTAAVRFGLGWGAQRVLSGQRSAQLASPWAYAAPRNSVPTSHRKNSLAKAIEGSLGCDVCLGVCPRRQREHRWRSGPPIIAVCGDSLFMHQNDTMLSVNIRIYVCIRE